MKKVLSKSYICLIYVFFALFAIILRADANDSTNLYSIGLMIASIFLAIIPFFTNHCKKIEARRMYLATMILISVSIVFITTYYLLVDVVSANETLLAITTWVIRISQALFISSTLFTIFYTVKDYFKKGYEIQKFDLDAIQMVVNLLAYIGIFYALFDFGSPEVILSIGGWIGSIDDFFLRFDDFNIIRNAIFIISAIYIVIYITLEVVKYLKFEKIEDNSNSIYK